MMLDNILEPILYGQIIEWRVWPTGGLFTRTVNVSVFVSYTFDIFDVTYKQYHRIALNPFLCDT